MVKCGVLFEVRTKFLKIIKTSVGFKGLNKSEKTDLVCITPDSTVAFPFPKKCIFTYRMHTERKKMLNRQKEDT
jgi:hypothetical protein